MSAAVARAAARSCVTHLELVDLPVVCHGRPCHRRGHSANGRNLTLWHCAAVVQRCFAAPSIRAFSRLSGESGSSSRRLRGVRGDMSGAGSYGLLRGAQQSLRRKKKLKSKVRCPTAKFR